MFPETAPLERVVTTGPWANEDEAKLAFDQVIGETGLFKVYREVPGYYVSRRLDQEDKTARIDRILSPTDRLIQLGWRHGPIGVELKAPGMKVGPVIAQMLDYSRAVWTIPAGFHFYLGWIFLWHLEKQTNAIGSILAQHRLGTTWIHNPRSPWGGLFFYSGDLHFLRIRNSGEIELGSSNHGKRMGSR